MKVLLRGILYKAISPPYCIVDMEHDVWLEFLNGDNNKRKEIAFKLVNRSGWSNSYVREIAWVPLDNERMLNDLANLL